VEITETRDYPGPLVIDAEILASLAKAAEAGRTTVIADIASRCNRAIEVVNAVAEGEDTNEEDYRVDAIRHYLSSFATSEFGIEFEGGTKVSTNLLQEAIDALNSEPTPAVSMTINYGSVSSYRVRLSIGGWSRKALSASILGSRADIAHSRDLLDRTMANASPPTSWLYSKWTKRTLVASVWSLWLFLGLALFVYATTRSGLPVNTLTSVIMLPYGMAIAVLADQVSKRYSKMFPLIDFRFGSSARRRVSARSALLWTIASLIVPVILFVLSVILA
jgi:hypothetical protein